MATPEQRAARRAAQRATAKRVKAPGGYKPVLRKETQRARQSHKAYLQDLLANPSKIKPSEHKMLAREASKARWNRTHGLHPGADPRYEDAWSRFFYHKEK